MKTTKSLLQAGLVALLALASFSSSVNAQVSNDVNKRELLLRTLDQSRPNEYVPVFFNLHYPDKFGYNAVKSHIEFFKATNVDFVNVKFETVFPAVDIKTVDDWKKIEEVPLSYWEPQLKVVEELARELKDQAFIIPTVYSSFAQILNAVQAANPNVERSVLRKRIVDLVNKDPKAAQVAFEKTSRALQTYIREAAKRGADGFYISSQGDDVTSWGANGIWDKYLRQSDIQISQAAAEVAAFNILHVCEAGGKFAKEAFNDYVEYPGSIVNVPVHEFEGEPVSLQQVAELFKRPVLGGFTRTFIDTHSFEESAAVVDEILKNAPQNFILGADDSVLPNSSDYDKLRAVVDYAHTWRQTHK